MMEPEDTVVITLCHCDVHPYEAHTCRPWWILQCPGFSQPANSLFLGKLTA